MSYVQSLNAKNWFYPFWLIAFISIAYFIFAPENALAHGVADGDKGYLRESFGILILPYIYLGAKHMITGYDHILFLLGVIFYLYRFKDIATYVSLFAIGHSVTLLFGTIFKIEINPYIIDAIIGFSVVYKALDNMGAFVRWFGFQPNTKMMTLVFGLFHGFGLATKILDLQMPPDAIIPNLLAFNIGVEIGQVLALSLILIAMGYWRLSKSFQKTAYASQIIIMTCGFILIFYQISGLLIY